MGLFSTVHTFINIAYASALLTLLTTYNTDTNTKACCNVLQIYLLADSNILACVTTMSNIFREIVLHVTSLPKE